MPPQRTGLRHRPAPLNMAARYGCRDGWYLHRVPVRQLVLDGLLALAHALGPLLLLAARVQRHVAALFLDGAHHFLLGAGVEDGAGLAQQRLQVLRHVAPGHVGAPHPALHREPFVHRHRVRHPVAHVQHRARRPPGRVQRQHRLHAAVQRRRVERLEEHLGGRVAVGARVEGGLGEEDGVLDRPTTGSACAHLSTSAPPRARARCGRRNGRVPPRSAS